MTSDATTSRVANGRRWLCAASRVLFARFLLSRVCPAARRRERGRRMQMCCTATMRLDSAGRVFICALSGSPFSSGDCLFLLPAASAAGERANARRTGKEGGSREREREREGEGGTRGRDVERQSPASTFHRPRATRSLRIAPAASRGAETSGAAVCNYSLGSIGRTLYAVAFVAAAAAAPFSFLLEKLRFRGRLVR